MSNRFYSSASIDGSYAVLDGPEAHHLLHVMRLTAGAEVVLFDGSGCEFTARVLRTGRSDVKFEILDRREVDRELPFDFTIGVALPKGDRQRWLIEKSVELGVTRVVPLVVARGVAQPGTTALTRLRRAVIEAAKQCGRNCLAEITEPSGWSEFISMPGNSVPRFVAHPGGEPLSDLANIDVPNRSTVCVAVGPEGGFTDSEVETATNLGWQVAGLGPRILRVETAVVAVAAAVTQIWHT